jgi:hypothetical protein
MEQYHTLDMPSWDNRSSIFRQRFGLSLGIGVSL